MGKVYALATLAVISLFGPVLEAALTGRVDPFGKFALGQTFLSIAPIYWWYYIDKEQKQFRAGPMLNIGVIALAFVALPVYFIKSRGWKHGGISIVKAVGVLAVTIALGWLGDAIGTAIAS